MPGMVRAAYPLPFVLVAACCPPLAEPVVVRTVIPAALTAPCIHEADPRTNGELLEAYEEARQTIADCDARLAEIRSLGKE